MEDIINKINKILLINKMNDKLFAAIDRGDIIEVIRELDSVKNINFVSPQQGTPLMKAIHNNKLEIIKLLLNRGADVNIKDPLFNETALLHAVRSGYVLHNKEIIKLLLDYGADVNVRDLAYTFDNGKKKLLYSKNAITYAVENNNLDAFILLIDYGADYTEILDLLENDNTEHKKMLKYIVNHEYKTRVIPKKDLFKQAANIMDKNMFENYFRPGGTFERKNVLKYKTILGTLQEEHPTKKRKLEFGKVPKNLKSKAKKLGIRLTVTRNGKRVPKTKKVLLKQIKLSSK
jgi:hypothetical protein